MFFQIEGVAALMETGGEIGNWGDTGTEKYNWKELTSVRKPPGISHFIKHRARQYEITTGIVKRYASSYVLYVSYS